MNALLTNLPNIQAVLFDMDGTLIDTDDQMVERLARWLRPLLHRRARPAARTLLMHAETPGNALIRLLDIVGLDRPMTNVTDRLRRRRGLYPAAEFKLIAGMDAALPRLHDRYQLGIVSTRSRHQIDAFYHQFAQIAPLFSTECGIQDTRRLKPHPAPVRLAAQRLNILPEHCVMVGDTAVDILSARRAGAWAVGVLCGFGEHHELQSAGAHVILDTTAQIADLLQAPPVAHA